MVTLFLEPKLHNEWMGKKLKENASHRISMSTREGLPL